MSFKMPPEKERCLTHLMYISPIYRYNKKIRIYIKQSNHNSPFSTFNSQLKKGTRNNGAFLFLRKRIFISL